MMHTGRVVVSKNRERRGLASAMEVTNQYITHTHIHTQISITYHLSRARIVIIFVLIITFITQITS